MQNRPWFVPTAVVSAILALQLSACSDGGDPTEPSGSQTVAASADTASVRPGESTNLLANDQVGGNQATASNATVAATGALPSGLSLSSGRVAVASDAAPGVYTFTVNVCSASTPTECGQSTATVTVLRLTKGVLVAPQSLASTSAATVRAAGEDGTKRPLARRLSTACPSVPAGYEPLASVTITPKNADGSAAGATFTTDACGNFDTAVAPSTAKLGIPATSGNDARDLDVLSFQSSTSLGSVMPAGATVEISSISAVDSTSVGFSVIDSVTKKAILGLVAGSVTAKVNGNNTSVTGVTSSSSTAAASTALVMDASGSMDTSVYTDSTTGKSYNRFALASIAAGSFVQGKGSSDEVAMIIFDSSVDTINNSFLAGQTFTDASGAARTFTLSDDGFSTDATKLTSLADLYNPLGATTSYCWNSGTLSSSCYPYLSGGDANLRRTSGYEWNGTTAVWKATDQGVALVRTRSNPRKYVVAMTDGQDNASGSITSSSLITKAVAAGVPVWMVAFGTSGAVNETEMQQVASQTGGSYFRRETNDIVGIFQGIQSSIRFQYTVTLSGVSLTSGQVVTLEVGGVTRELTLP